MTEEESQGLHPPETTLPAEVYEGLCDLYEQKPGVANRRRHERKPWAATLTVWVEDMVGTKADRRELEVTTHDISRGGIGFVYQQFLHPGTVIHVRFDSLPSRPVVTGVVANCIYVGGKQHRIGVQFVSKAGKT